MGGGLPWAAGPGVLSARHARFAVGAHATGQRRRAQGNVVDANLRYPDSLEA